MLRAAIGFFVVGLIAFVLGLGNIGGLSLEIGRIILFVFLALAILSFLISMITGKKVTNINLILPLMAVSLASIGVAMNAYAIETPAEKVQAQVGDATTHARVQNRKIQRKARNFMGDNSYSKDAKDAINDSYDVTKNAAIKAKNKID